MASFDGDRARPGRSKEVGVLDPSRDEAVLILKGLRSRDEEHHSVKYTDPALEAAVDLSAKHLVDRHLPDKAIDVMDEAGALQRITSPQQRGAVIRGPGIEPVVGQIARIPPRSGRARDQDATTMHAPHLAKWRQRHDT